MSKAAGYVKYAIILCRRRKSEGGAKGGEY